MTPEAPKDMRSVLVDKHAVHEALREARREAMRLHRMMNLPMAVWRNGEVVWLEPDQFPTDEDSQSTND
jgi:hypothetical protein